MNFPTGGKVRERKLNWCNSNTDSIVWMKEIIIINHACMYKVAYRVLINELLKSWVLCLGLFIMM